MKYFTKEWFIKDSLCSIMSRVKESEIAETKDEERYLELYRKKLSAHLAAEKQNDLYKNPKEELQRYDIYISEPGITEEERRKRIQYKQTFIETNKDRIDNNLYFIFDENLFKQKFDNYLNQNIELLHYLPKRILKNVADIRILALGLVCKKVMRLLNKYCAKQKKACNKIRNRAFSESDKVEETLTKQLNTNLYDDALIMDIYEQDGDIYLEFEYGQKLQIINGEITEREQDKIYKWNIDIPSSGMSLVQGTEMHYKNGKYELCFLMENTDEYGKSALWYLTIRGNDILEIPAPPNQILEMEEKLLALAYKLSK